MRKRKAFVILVLMVLIFLILRMIFSGTQGNGVYESNMILVNKECGLPQNYVPSDLVSVDIPFALGVDQSRKQMRAEAAKALEKMFVAAAEDGIELLGVSGYRSYYTQKKIYENRLEEMGQEHVDKYNAKPGHSEHQTGLAVDVGCPGCVDLTERFADTDTYKWLQKNAHLYGFIIRYPEDGEQETGYAFEPWHLRYVGDEARAIQKSGLTMERYVEINQESEDGLALFSGIYKRK